MAYFMENKLSTLGIETRVADLGTATVDGQKIKLPPAILGKVGEDPKKKTILVYGHFDVQPVSFVVVTVVMDQQNRTCEYRLSRVMDGALIRSP